MVEVSVWGVLPEADRATLFSLLEKELEGSHLALAAAPSAGASPSQPQTDPVTLMRVVLDVRSPSAWRVSIVDVARGKALRRELAGPKENAAALEATASILGAAAAALHEGFELGAAAPSPPPPRRQRVLSPRRAPFLRAVGALGVDAASFDHHVPLQFAPAASLGLSVGDRVILRARAAHYFPVAFESRFGRFELDRTHLGFTAGLMVSRSPWEGEVSLGLLTELLRRSGAISAPTVAASTDDSFVRAAGELRAVGRIELWRHVSVELALGAAYFPGALRFVAAVGTDPVLVEPFALVALGGLALQLRAP